MPSASDRFDFGPPKAQGSVRAFVLALLVHGLLVAALTWGVNWKRSDPSPPYEAELWAAVPQQAAPRRIETPAETRPEAVRLPPLPLPVPTLPEPTPAPKPAPEKPSIKAQTPPPPPPLDADIARAQEKKRKQLAIQQQARAQKEAEEALAKKQKALKAQEEQAKRLAQAQAVKEEKKAKEAKETKEAEKRQAQKLAQQLALQQDRDKQAQAASQKQRQENLDRLKGMASATGSATDTGTALKTAGPSASYAGMVRAAIRPNVVFAEEIVGNPMATVEVRVTSDGTVVGQRLTKPSGNKAWDDAAINAIIRTRVMPKDTNGRVPDTILLIDMRPRE